MNWTDSSNWFSARTKRMSGGAKVKRLSLTGDATSLAGYCYDRSLRIWRKNAQSPQNVLPAADNILDFSWNEDAKQLCSVTIDGLIKFYSLDNGKASVDLIVKGGLRHVAWSPASNVVAACSGSSFIHLVDSTTKAFSKPVKLSGTATNFLAWHDREDLLLAVTDVSISVVNSSSELIASAGNNAKVTGVHWLRGTGRICVGRTYGTVEFYDYKTLRLLSVIETPHASVSSITSSPDARVLFVLGAEGRMSIWRTEDLELLGTANPGSDYFLMSDIDVASDAEVMAVCSKSGLLIETVSFKTDEILQRRLPVDSVHYSNAKVVLVGDSGVGKSALAGALMEKAFVPTDSTHSFQVFDFAQEVSEIGSGISRLQETMLWDLAGQPGYRVYYRLHLSQVAVALVAFNSQSDTQPFASVPYWAKAIEDSRGAFPTTKILVAARSDRGYVKASKETIDSTKSRFGFESFVETSAKQGVGIEELRRLVHRAIDWDRMPVITAPKTFYRVRQRGLALKVEGRVLLTRDELFESLLEEGELDRQAFDICVERLETSGILRQLSFGGLLLLKPELLDDYCAWIAQAARRDERGIGAIPEHDARNGGFMMDHDRLLANQPEVEEKLLVASLEEIVSRGIAARQETDSGSMIVFPSESRKDLPLLSAPLTPTVEFTFEGSVSAIYAVIAVGLMNSSMYKLTTPYKDALLLRVSEGNDVGIALEYPDHYDESVGNLVVSFSESTGQDARLLVLRYIQKQLEKHAIRGSTKLDAIYACCGERIAGSTVRKRVELGKKDVRCPVCEEAIQLSTLVETLHGEDLTFALEVERMESAATEAQAFQERKVTVDLKVRTGDYDVFLCHNSLDKKDVRKLKNLLQDQGVTSWMDEGGIQPGDQHVEVLERHLRLGKAVAIVVGKNGLGRWQNQEYLAFFQRYVSYDPDRDAQRTRIIPVLLPGFDPYSVEVPAFLDTFSNVDFTGFDGLEDERMLASLVAACYQNIPTHPEA